MRMLVALVLVMAVCVHGWGPLGHEITAKIAQQYITPQAKAAILKISSESGGEIYKIVDWADKMSHGDYPWSEPLHYMNTPDWACAYDRARDCKTTTLNPFCVDAAVGNYSKRVTDHSLDSKQLDEALKFLVHFIGDSHQPLHCGFASNRGGNDFEGEFFNERRNLHSIWDGAFLDKRRDDDFGRSVDKYVDSFLTRLKGEWASQVPEWTKCKTTVPFNACSGEWVDECTKYACQYAYVDAQGRHIQSGFKMGDADHKKNYPPSELQLAKAGIRMAGVLNNIFH